MKFTRQQILLAILGGTAAVLAFTKRESIMLYGARALEVGKEYAFSKAISNQAAPYSAIILQVARETGVDPFLIYALGQRESRWGSALTPFGPSGTGDGGHGRGIMQIDDRSWGTWIASNNWRDPYTNVRKGAEILNGMIRFFSGKDAVAGYTDGVKVYVDESAPRFGVDPGTYPDPRPLVGDRLVEAAIASYNTGPGNVLMALAVGADIDTTTAGSDYSADVWSRMLDAVGRFA
jgi:soluble lytic murein transglycosylase-like protein